MQTSELIDALSGLLKGTNGLLRNLKAIQRLDKDREANLPSLRRTLSRLDPSSLHPHLSSNLIEDIKHWKTEYEEGLLRESEREFARLGITIEAELHKNGLRSSQKGSGIAVGVFLLKWDKSRRVVQIFYGPEEEELAKCPLSARQVVATLMEQRRSLGSTLPPEEFLSRLKQAYLRVNRESPAQPVPLTEILPEISLLCQKNQFRRNPVRENYVSYSRAHFSYDLYRCRGEGVQMGLRLRTATFARTSSRAGFLWVPSADSTDGGDRYSDLTFGRT
ncbi:MAG: hypothetical protein NTW86_15035 [Candidatus Sumerlaeota bacterium]|nr:hypothetical protein [Candidatus Sumerlaeota bacterium]